MDDEKVGEVVGSSLTGGEGPESAFPLIQWPSEEQGGREDATSVSLPVPSFGDEWSVFPPKEHEDLYIQQESPVAAPSSSCFSGSDFANSALGPRSLSFSTLFSRWRSGDRALWEHRILVEKTRFMGLVGKLVDRGMAILYARFPICTTMAGAHNGKGGAGAIGDGFWSLTAFAVVALTLLYMRRKHSQERFRLLLLIHEKDKMIAQLLQKIVQMNERSPQHVPDVTIS